MPKIVTSGLIMLPLLGAIAFGNRSIYNVALAENIKQEQQKQTPQLTTLLLKTIPVTSGIVRSIAISSDNRTIISGSDAGNVQFWSLKTGKLIRTLPKHGNWIQSVVVSPDNQRIASGSVDGTIKIWDFNGQLLRTLNNKRGIYSLFWSPNNKFIASGDAAGTIKLWDVQGKLIRSINGHSSNVVAINISPNSHILVSKSFKIAGNYDEEIKFWNLETGKLVNQKIAGSVGGVNSLAISPDGNLLAGYEVTYGATSQAVYIEEAIKIWRLQTGEFVNSLKMTMDRPHAIAFSPDSQNIAIGGFSQKIEIWNVATGKQVTTFSAPHQIYSLAFSRDGKNLISSGAGSIAIWSVK